MNGRLAPIPVCVLGRVLALVLAPVLALVLALVLLLTPSGSAGAQGNGSPRSAEQVVEDAFGRRFPISAPPTRIVSLSPSLTEALFAIGVPASRIVGVTRYCDFPEEAKSIDRIGGIIDPSIETILAKRPDLVLVTRGNPMPVIERLRAAGLPVFALDAEEGLDKVLEAMRILIRVAQPARPEAALEAVDRLGSEVERLRVASSRLVESDRPTVYYYDPVSAEWTAGPGTHVSEAIALAGGKNLADDAGTAWPRYTLERIVADPPDRLLIAAPAEDPDGAAALERLRRSPGWREIPAVREGNVCVVPADWLMRPGPRLVRAIQTIADCLQPGSQTER